MIWRCDLEPQAQQYLEKLVGITREVLQCGRYVLASRLVAFEKEYAAYIGADHCVGVGNGTDALILALKAIGMAPGDEVITTPFTAIPTISAIVAAGGRPVFVDIDPETFLIDVEKIPAAVTERTRAIIPVHLFSQMVDIERLRSLLPRTIPVIEDAAQAHGCSLRGRNAGSLGEMSAFSFYPTKNLGGYGDGGAVVTSDPQLAERLRLLRNYGKESPDNIVLDGINSRLDEIQAAYLSVKLPDLEGMNMRRRAIAEGYKQGLQGTSLVAPVIADGNVPNYHVYTVKVPDRRDELKQFLSESKIQTDIFYPFPHHMHPAYSHLNYREGDFPHAESVGRQVLSLPMYPEMKEDVLDVVCEKIHAFYRGMK